MTLNLYTYWTTIADDELTVEKLEKSLASVQDDLWAAAICSNRIVDDVEVQKALLRLGIGRTQNAVARSKDAALSFSSNPRDSSLLEHSASESGVEAGSNLNVLVGHFQSVPADMLLCSMRAVLLERLDRLNTFVEMCKAIPEMDEEEDEIVEWEDDPWADETGSFKSVHEARLSSQFPLSLSTFLTDDLLNSARLLASIQSFEASYVILKRHTKYLWPYRFLILDSIPEHVHPADYRILLPSFDHAANAELAATPDHWRAEQDWSETAEVQVVLKESASAYSLLAIRPTHDQFRSSPLTADELSAWYIRRIEDIIASTSLIDVALATVQHGASQGIPGLDELGEELSLLSRLVYDAPQGADISNEWTLGRWRSMSASDVVHTYLAHSTPATLPKDITCLVMPYLYVLESRAERAGSPDPHLPTRLFFDYILSAPLEMTAAIFEASKPTLSVAQRLIRDDQDMIRLALACLYGSDGVNQWAVMSRIFECLPAWDVSLDENDGVDVADTVVLSLGAFVTPSVSRPTCRASDLLVFFRPLPLASLSRALDILDVHLESGEILSRWNVPAPLRWFLHSNADANEQRAWANKMARRAGGPEDRLSSEDDWEWLLQDMIRLSGEGDNGRKSAFGLLSRKEIVHIFFSGLLSTGQFDIARNLLRSPENKKSFEPSQIEEICLSCSREFYDNATSGNYKFGSMKLAYDCLSVPPPSDRLLKEKEFIEATSRISSFNVTSTLGLPISPIEIRLTKDRLSLVSRVLSSNNDAYKHAEVILDLVHKLGFRDDAVAEVKTLAMLADTALQAEDFSRAYDLSGAMVDIVVNLGSSSPSAVKDSEVAEAREVCWVACFQLGRQLEFHDLDKKLSLLGRALELCPAEKLHDILAAWRRLEKDDIEIREMRLSSRDIETGKSRTRQRKGNMASSLRERLQEFHMPSSPLLSTPDATALATRTLRSVAANFPFSVSHSNRPRTSDGDKSHTESQKQMEREDVSVQATRVFSKGIGWLIGADEEL
ncbi:Sec39-domain-containing protein [Tricholoma matsutake]|nr:Sec39-domain-containing protein [Tricholoma matsutake 945]